ncbi:MAG: PIN domain-containing protein [Verrucomicrobiota bacterium]|nr:PIN domain-containing protein [Verrucomicrobiota bacterium]
MPASLFDTSAWLAAVLPKHPAHRNAQAVLQAATALEPVVFCRATEVSFLRLLTTPRLLRLYEAEHMTNRLAMEVLRFLLSRAAIIELSEPPGTADLWHRLAIRDNASPKVWMDAYLAAFAICGGLQLVTLDSDFKAYEAHRLRVLLLDH